MTNNPLEKKLISNSKERVESNHSDIDKVKLLLAADAKEETDVLKSIVRPFRKYLINRVCKNSIPDTIHYNKNRH